MTLLPYMYFVVVWKYTRSGNLLLTTKTIIGTTTCILPTLGPSEVGRLRSGYWIMPHAVCFCIYPREYQYLTTDYTTRLDLYATVPLRPSLIPFAWSRRKDRVA